VKRYGLTVMACAVVTALATLMAGVATRDGTPAPVVLDAAPRPADVAQPAPTPRADPAPRGPAARRADAPRRERVDGDPVGRAAPDDDGRDAHRAAPAPARAPRPTAGGDDGPDGGDEGEDAGDVAEEAAAAPPPASDPAPAEDDDDAAEDDDDAAEADDDEAD
jgi:hypothetical protein